ncbi:PAS domain S-box protein [Sphingomonas solaris]|uniref:histidine kinase n=1 Tax=Alterirhizorhabdus solaris TaxID=2529389 RepID=A0A558R9G0_9SPHN|nr:PAS domain S-box protein [Sphingomonas solaris]TVV76017.1 PAS domain S-box protein [Sphingomonas solaris]
MTINESDRLAGLLRHRILDTAPEPPFDDAVALVQLLCDVPIALVSLVDADRQWFKAACGVDVRETARDTSVCSLAIESEGLFVIPDLSADPRTAAMSLVRDAPHLRFYAGAPLVTRDGIALGSLCAIDTVARPEGLSERQRTGLALVGRQVTALIETRMAAIGEAEAVLAGQETESHYRHVIDSAVDSAIIAIDPKGDVMAWSKGAETIFGWTETEMIGAPLATIFTPEDRAIDRPAREMRIAREQGRATDERWHLRKDGTRFYANGAVTPLIGADHRGFVKSLRDVTAEHENRVALAMSREELELASRAARLGRFDFRPGTGSLVWDDRCRELFGLPPGAPVSYEASFLAGLHPDDRDSAAAAVAAALDPTGTRAFDEEYRTIGIEDGIERHVAAHGLAFFEGDTPTRLIGTVQDVTASRRTLRRLAQTEERLRLASRATNDAIWDWDLVSDMVIWNEALTDAYGHAPADVGPDGAWWIGHIHPDDRERVGHGIHAVIDGTASDWTDHYRFLKADGSYADIQDRGFVIRDEHGRATRMIGAMLDQTEVRALLRQLESRAIGLAEEVKVRTGERDRLWETTSDLMATAGLDGYLKEVNPAWQRLLGWTEAELLARPFIVLVHPDDHAATAGVVAQLARGETVKMFVDHVQSADGSYRTLMWDAVPEGDRFYIVGRDLTEQRAIEDRLRQAQKMEAVGQLTGGIAHDFNNMLTGIIGSLDLLKRDIAGGRQDRIDRYMDAATTSAQRAAGLTDRLLAFSRRQSLDVQSIDVNSLVAGMEDLLRRTLGESVGLEVRLTTAAWPARTDANQLESALLNLAINARDAMPDGGRLTIETDNAVLDEHYVALLADEIAAGDYVVISVSDTGTGMAPDVIAKAFDPFFTTKPIGQGTGLGLSMIYGFARQSGGHARIYSEVGRGTTVKLYLPRAEVAAAIAQDGPAPLRRAEAGECVLVVEDDPAVRMLVIDVLQSLGYAVEQAADGPSALPLIDTMPRLDLLITDVGLPGMNGRQVAEIARQRRPDLPVLFVTGYAEKAAVRGGFLDEGMEMITKPFAIDALSARIREMLE